MGKKITKKKTKEIREVVGEASSASIVGREVSEQQQTQPRRKRGRPRKIIENTQVVGQGEEEKNRAEEQKEEEEEAVAVEEGDSKRMKTSEEEKLKGIRSTSSSSVGDVKGGVGPSDESKIKEPPKSRSGRRKSQPRKSS